MNGINENTSENKVKKEDLPWIIFELHRNFYAINSNLVTGILMLPENITGIPEAPEIFRGVSEIRKSVIPLLELRKLFQFPLLHEESDAFEAMLEQRKQDHIKWVDELILSVEENRPFELATDPHKCAFGKWYDNFTSKNGMVNMHLKKIAEPHTLLHESALQVLKCQHNCGSCERDECLEDVLKKAKNIYMPKVVELLDESKDFVEHEFREMVITLATDSNAKESVMGIIVDDVKAVQSIDIVCEGEELHKLHRNDYISGVAQNEMYEGQIMVINEYELIKLAQSINSTLSD